MDLSWCGRLDVKNCITLRIGLKKSTPTTGLIHSGPTLIEAEVPLLWPEFTRLDMSSLLGHAGALPVFKI